MDDGVGSAMFTWAEWGALASEDGPWADDNVTYGYNDALLRQTLTLIAPNGSPWTQSYGYDDSWRLANVTSAAGTFSYAHAGAQATPPPRLGLPNGAYITNAFDDLGRLVSTVLMKSSDTALNSHSYEYDNAHQRTKQTLQDGNYWDYGYDPIGELTSAKGKESGGGNRLHEQLTYGYDAAGNLAARTNNNLQQTFAISNLLNQLSAVTRSTNLTVAGMTTPAATNVTVNGAASALYADKTFAKEMANVSGGNNTFTAVASDSYGRSDTNAVTVTLPGLVTYQYDANGNLTNDTRRTFEYDDADQLTAVQVAASWRSEFKYDGIGRRRLRTERLWQNSQWVTASETRYVYDHMLVLQERDANNLPTVTYTRGIDLSGTLQRAGGIGGLLASTQPSTSNPHHFFYHADAGGNITALIDGFKNVVARYCYDPFGNLLGLSGPMAEANLYRFSSKEWHGNSGMYYYGFRFYEPSLQRWFARDFLEEREGANLYAFVMNSPHAYVDTDGLSVIRIVHQGGAVEEYQFPTLNKLLSSLRAAAASGNLITELHIKSHGNKEKINVGWRRIFPESLTTSERPDILSSRGEDLTDLFLRATTTNCLINLAGCMTGRGPSSVARRFSQALPGRVVIGGAWWFQINVPFTPYALGDKNVFCNGDKCFSIPW